MLDENRMAELVCPVKNLKSNKTYFKNNFFLQLPIIENCDVKVLVVLKVAKGLVKVSHGYSEVEFGKPGSLGNMTLPPRGESCNRTRPGQAWPLARPQTPAPMLQWTVQHCKISYFTDGNKID